jgi:hypothetical protein
VKDELERALRIADMLTTCHCILRDRFARRALILDLMILVASAWLVAMAFADPEIARHFILPKLSPTITIGLLAVATFILSLLQLRTDWKYQSERFDQAAKAYANSKLEIRHVLGSGNADMEDVNRVLDTFRAIGARVAAIPDRQFNRLKRKDFLKVRIRQLIDQHPGSSIVIMRLRVWWDDTKSLLARQRVPSPQGQPDQLPPKS